MSNGNEILELGIKAYLDKAKRAAVMEAIMMKHPEIREQVDGALAKIEQMDPIPKECSTARSSDEAFNCIVSMSPHEGLKEHYIKMILDKRLI